MNRAPLAITLMVLGLALLCLAPWLGSLAPTAAVWTDDQAREYGAAAADLHNAQHGAAHASTHGHAHDSAAHPKLAAAKAEFDKQQARLDGARSRVQIYKLLCQAVGVALAAGGAGMYLHLRIKGGR